MKRLTIPFLEDNLTIQLDGAIWIHEGEHFKDIRLAVNAAARKQLQESGKNPKQFMGAIQQAVGEAIRKTGD